MNRPGYLAPVICRGKPGPCLPVAGAKGWSISLYARSAAIQL